MNYTRNISNTVIEKLRKVIKYSKLYSEVISDKETKIYIPLTLILNNSSKGLDSLAERLMPSSRTFNYTLELHLADEQIRIYTTKLDGSLFNTNILSLLTLVNKHNIESTNNKIYITQKGELVFYWAYNLATYGYFKEDKFWYDKDYIVNLITHIVENMVKDVDKMPKTGFE